MLHFVSAFCLTLSDPQTLSTPLYIRLSRLSGFILSLLHFVLPPLYTITGTGKGRTLGMIGEIETEKVPKKCPKYGGDMKETGKAFLID